MRVCAHEFFRGANHDGTRLCILCGISVGTPRPVERQAKYDACSTCATALRWGHCPRGCVKRLGPARLRRLGWRKRLRFGLG